MTRLTFLGTGTSQGVPIIGCRCAVCKSADPRDKRFRSQMLAHGISHLDAILLTHNHKDHTGGLDDVRPDVQPAYDGLTLEDA